MGIRGLYPFVVVLLRQDLTKSTPNARQVHNPTPLTSLTATELKAQVLRVGRTHRPKHNYYLRWSSPVSRSLFYFLLSGPMGVLAIVIFRDVEEKEIQPPLNFGRDVTFAIARGEQQFSITTGRGLKVDESTCIPRPSLLAGPLAVYR